MSDGEQYSVVISAPGGMDKARAHAVAERLTGSVCREQAVIVRPVAEDGDGR